MKASLSLATLTAACLLGGAAHADSLEPVAAPTTPHWYATVFAGTTLASRAGGAVSGPSRDVTPMVGVGYLLSDAWALELDLGPTFLPEGYGSFSLTPGVVWSFSKNFYAAGRVTVPVHPSLGALVVSPGVGATVAFDSGLAPFVELDALAWRGAAGGVDLGGVVAVGVSYFF